MKQFSQQTYIVSIIIYLMFSFTENVFGQNKESTPGFGFHSTGNSVIPRFGEDWYENLELLEENNDEFNCLLRTIATKPKKKKDILAHCGMSAQWLNEAIDILKSHNCMAETADHKFYSKVPVLIKSEMKRMQRSLKPIAVNVAKEINKYIPEIKKQYAKLKSDSDPDWEDIAHFIIDKLLIDGQFHLKLVELEKKNGIKRYYTMEQKAIPAWFLENYTRYGTSGANWYSIKGEKEIRDIYFLHGSPLMRFDFPLNQYRNNKDFDHALHKADNNGSLIRLNEREIQIFKDLGWVVNDNLAVPILNSEGLKMMFDNVLKKTGYEAAKVVFDNFSVIMDSYHQSPYSKMSEGAGDYIQICYHLIFTGIINELIKLDALPPIPEPTPEYFGVYITNGSLFNGE